jgi:Mrp family chromosome partitioning ATPase
MNALVAFEDTLRLLSRVVDPDPRRLEQERILPPKAGGPRGAPYKMLRTQVLQRMATLKVNSVAIVGATETTGKTLTAINLAIAIAADPERTALLIDLDLRRPSINRRFGFEVQHGIDDCLRDGDPLRGAMVRVSGYDRLVVLPARQHCEDSSELLGLRKTEELIAEMRNRYTNRILVFDLPPVLLADDALAVLRHVQSGLVVVGDGHTKREELTRTMALMRDLPILGTVLNGSREPLHGYY